MTKLCFAILVGCLVLTSSASAQDSHQVEVYGGYSYVRTGDDVNLNGVDVSISAGLTKGLSIEGAFSGNFGNSEGAGVFVDASSVPATFPLETPFYVTNYRANINQYLYLAGPKYTFRLGRVEPFVHALFGGAHRRVTADATLLSGLAFDPPSNVPIAFSGEKSDSSFALSAGGGVDARLTSHLWLRAIQADYVMTRFDKGYPDFGAVTQNNVKISVGLVYRF